MKIYITRHGTTEWNISRRLQGWKDSNLTKEGIKNAISLGKRLASIDFDVIYSSPQNRAVETAKLIRAKRDIPIVNHKALREMRYGIWEGMTLDDIYKNYPEEFHNYVNNPDAYIPVDGETYNDLFKRVDDFLEEIIEKDDKNILVVTHGIPIKAIIAKIKGLSIEEFAKIPIYTGTSLHIFEVKDGRIHIVVEDDISHLESI